MGGKANPAGFPFRKEAAGLLRGLWAFLGAVPALILAVSSPAEKLRSVPPGCASGVADRRGVFSPIGGAPQGACNCVFVKKWRRCVAVGVTLTGKKVAVLPPWEIGGCPCRRDGGTPLFHKWHAWTLAGAG